MSCVQLCEGGFQVAYPDGLWEWLVGVVTVLCRYGEKIIYMCSYIYKHSTWVIAHTCAQTWLAVPVVQTSRCCDCTWLRRTAHLISHVGRLVAWDSYGYECVLIRSSMLGGDWVLFGGCPAGCGMFTLSCVALLSLVATSVDVCADHWPPGLRVLLHA